MTAASVGRPSLGRRRLGCPRSRRGAGLRARVRRARGGRNGGRSRSGWLPCSARGRRLRCRPGARRLPTYGRDRRRGAAARCPRRSERVSSSGCGSCATAAGSRRPQVASSPPTTTTVVSGSAATASRRTPIGTIPSPIGMASISQQARHAEPWCSVSQAEDLSSGPPEEWTMSGGGDV